MNTIDFDGWVTELTTCTACFWFIITALQVGNDSISVHLWPSTDADLLSDPQPNHAVLQPLALQLCVPRGHFFGVEVKTV